MSCFQGAILQTPLERAQEQLVWVSGIKGSLRGTVVVKAACWICQGTVTGGINCLPGEERVPDELDSVPAHGTVFVQVLFWSPPSRRFLAHPSFPGCAPQDYGMLTVWTRGELGLEFRMCYIKNWKFLASQIGYLKSNGYFHYNTSLLQISLSREIGLIWLHTIPVW